MEPVSECLRRLCLALERLDLAGVGRCVTELEAVLGRNWAANLPASDREWLAVKLNRARMLTSHAHELYAGQRRLLQGTSYTPSGLEAVLAASSSLVVQG